MRYSLFLLMFFVSSVAYANNPQDFKSWLSAFETEAVQKHGISQQVLDKVFTPSFKPIPRIIELDRKQPERTMTFENYLNKIVNQTRKDKAAQKAQDYHNILSQVENEYGVDRQFVVALWGIETNFGQNMGGYHVPQALATLAYDGRRASYFRNELIKSLKILQQGNVTHDNFLGSWAGAMGQVQFMPSSFYHYAVDENGDGRRDIWTTKEDVFGSAANYLAKNGWKKGEPWGYEVIVPANFDRGFIGMDYQYTGSYWNRAGVRLTSGKTIPDHGLLKASLIQPDGKDTRAFLVYDNFRTIMRWNKSVYFATSAGILADAVAQAPVSHLNR